MSQDFTEFTWPDRALAKSTSGYEYKNLKGPLFLSVDVTNRCNFHCKHCFNNSGDNATHNNFADEMTDAELIALASQILEVKPYSVCICGGEPLLRFNILGEFISILTSQNIQVSMVSNGYLFTASIAKELRDAGLIMAQISVDGADAETHDTFRNMPGSFDRAIQAISFLKEAGIQTAVSFVPNRTNIKSFPQYVNLIRSLKCDEIRMMPFIPMGRGLGNFVDLEATPDDYLDFTLHISKVKPQLKEAGINIMWGDPLEHIYLATYFREYPVMMEIRSNGDLGVSEYLPFRVGNIRRHTIKEYWDNGYNRIWAHPEIKALVSSIKTIYDFQSDRLKTWNMSFKMFDLINADETSLEEG